MFDPEDEGDASPKRRLTPDYTVLYSKRMKLFKHRTDYDRGQCLYGRDFAYLKTTVVAETLRGPRNII
jgi:hypothetical protein